MVVVPSNNYEKMLCPKLVIDSPYTYEFLFHPWVSQPLTLSHTIISLLDPRFKFINISPQFK
jgi:hypothetical protein